MSLKVKTNLVIFCEVNMFLGATVISPATGTNISMVIIPVASNEER
jgi:hypothetical protein